MNIIEDDISFKNLILDCISIHKDGKNIKCRKTKFKTSKFPLIVINNIYCGLVRVKIDADVYSFKIGETYFIQPKYA